jgi:hypothetical protein
MAGGPFSGPPVSIFGIPVPAGRRSRCQPTAPPNLDALPFVEMAAVAPVSSASSAEFPSTVYDLFVEFTLFFHFSSV